MFFGGNKKIIKTGLIFTLLFFVFNLFIGITNAATPMSNEDFIKLTPTQRFQEMSKCTGNEITKKNITTVTYSALDSCNLSLRQYNNSRVLVDAGYFNPPDDDEKWYDKIVNKLNPAEWFSDALDSVYQAVNSFIIETFGLLLRLSGIILNSIIQYTIFGMSDFVKETEAIKVSWEIIRDIVNMTFIFGLLYISIRTIIFGIGNMKNLLAGIIVAALLINFSYFFTTVLIDVSNYITTQIYTQLADSDCAGNNITSSFDSGLSNCFLSKTKIMTLQNPTIPGGLTSEITNNGANGSDFLSALSATVLGSIFIIILSFVLFALAIMLAIRFIVLIFLLITSPVMFLGLVLPFFKGLSSGWFKKLSDNLLFPPLAFLFILITMSIADQIQRNFSSDGLVNNTINFILITGFAVASLLIAKSTGAAGASFATAKAGNIVFGGTAKAGRNIIGRSAASVADRMKGTGAVSVATRNALKSVGSKTFDVRNSKGFKGVASATGLTKDLDLGKAQSKGFSQLREAKEKEFKKTYDTFGKQTADEVKKIDNLRLKMEDEFASELKSIEKAEEKIKDLKKEQDLVEKGSDKYKELDKQMLEQKKVVSDNRKIIETDTRGGKTIEKDGKQVQISINDEIKELEKAGKERQKTFLNRITKGLESTLASKAAARQIRADKEKKKKETDVDKIIKGIKDKDKGDDKKEDKKEDDKKAA